MSAQYFGFNSTQERTLRTLLGADNGGQVDTADLAAGAVTTAKIANSAVGTTQLAASAVTNAKVDAAAAIALSKLANVAAGTDGLAGGTIQAQFQALQTFANNLNTWAIALATKLNADAGVTDVNYDTNPQA